MAIELDNSFTVPVPVEQAWDVLLDVERIAPCMPGATVTEVNGDEITGTVKVKLGPVSLTYKGTAKFTEKDTTARSVSVEASGKETRGAGTAAATVQAALQHGEDENQTAVSMHTSLNITGRPAQFGRGVMADVSAKLVDQFSTNLAALLSQGNAEAPDPAPATETSDEAAPSDAAPVPIIPAVPQREEHLNVVRLVAVPMLKRLIPVAAIAGAIAILYRRVFRRSKSSLWRGPDEAGAGALGGVSHRRVG